MWLPLCSSKTYLTRDISPRFDLFKSCYLENGAIASAATCTRLQGSCLTSCPHLHMSLLPSLWIVSTYHLPDLPTVSRSPLLLSPLVWTTEIISCLINFHLLPQSILHIVMRVTFFIHSSGLGILCLNPPVVSLLWGWRQNSWADL